ncbi:MAG: hypothetical protein V4696_05115 [Pseudomonadota bacterium]
MTASLSGEFNTQQLTDLGALGFGLRLYTYTAGTTTHKTVYTDAAASVAHTYTNDGSGGQYLALNARGEVPAPLFLTAGAYDIALKTAAGATIWTRRAVPVGDSIAPVLADFADTGTAGKGDALIGLGAVTSITAGVVTRHASIAAAITAVGSSVTEIVIRGATTVAANSTIPATCALRIEGGAVVTVSSAITLTASGAFSCERRQCFSGAGKVVFAASSPVVLAPEWWGATPDAVIDGTGTDSTAAILACIAASTDTGLAGGVAIHPIDFAGGNYLISNIVWPVASTVRFSGIHVTNFIVKTGTTGAVMTDGGSAAKITFRGGFAIYARGLAGITYGLRLGNNGTQFGTEGYIESVWVRDVSGASAVWGIDINGNVGKFGDLIAQSCTSGVRINGSANMVDKLVCYAPTVVGVDLDLIDVQSMEIEAPGDSCVPLKLTGNASIDGLTISLANGTTISHLIEIGAGATVWKWTPFYLAFGDTPAGITVSNGNFKRADGTYFGGNATAGSRDGEGNYSSNEAGQRLQCFTLTVVNTAGTLQHKITDPSVAAATNFAAKITGASATLGNTPTGADSSTAMATGGKIGSASSSIFWLDTRVQKVGDALVSAFVQANSSGTALSVSAGFASLNINGVTRNRLYFQLLNATTGDAFALTTVNIASGKLVQINFMGYLA